MSKIFSSKELSKEIKKLKKNGKKTALLHGVFDILHVGHINYFERVMNEFFDQNQISEGKVSATVTSFVKLTVSQKDEITKKICGVFKVDDVEISENLDKSILGGYIIKVGDTIIDCSTKNKLNGLENHLLRSTTL